MSIDCVCITYTSRVDVQGDCCLYAHCTFFGFTIYIIFRRMRVKIENEKTVFLEELIENVLQIQREITKQIRSNLNK